MLRMIALAVIGLFGLFLAWAIGLGWSVSSETSRLHEREVMRSERRRHSLMTRGAASHPNSDTRGDDDGR